MRKMLFLAVTLCCAFIATSNAENRPNNPTPQPDNKEYTMADVWAAYEGFNNVFLDTKKYIYKHDNTFARAKDRFNGVAAIWCQPMYWNMAMDACLLAEKVGDKKRAEEYRSLVKKIYNGNRKHYAGFNFHDNNENTGWFIYDDIMWWTISLARGYELFGDEDYLRYSEDSFSRVWYGSDIVGDNGSYDPNKGGMFWRWYPIQNPKPNESSHGKMACINFPTVCAAMMLHNNVPADREEPKGDKPLYQTKEGYLKMAKDIYAWGEKNLFDPKTGRIADSRHGEGRPDWKVHIYNQATFIGSSALLYLNTGDKHYLENAVKAADYSCGAMSARYGLLPFERGIEQGIYTAIFAQYMAILVYDCGQTQYLPFLYKNITTGWANRDKSRNIIDGEYHKRTAPYEMVDSYEASGIPSLMLLFPPQE